MDIAYHYPPDLLNLLIETIPTLCRGKKDVLTLFRGAGVELALMQDLASQVKVDPKGIGKHEIARTVLTRLNEKGETTLRERRELLRRITEWEDFSTCWPDDQLKAKGLVAEIRNIVNVKDTFTRINLEREEERRRRRAEYQAKLQEVQLRKEQLLAVKSDLCSLFNQQNHWKRGKALESVLDRLFQLYGILVREAFTLVGDEGQGIVEQIDGVIEIDGAVYLVEVKWLTQPVGKGEISEHLVRVFSRGDARGIFISASDYTEPAIATCKDALHHMVVVLCRLKEFIDLLEDEKDLKAFLKEKINAAIIDKRPFHEPLRSIS